VSEDRPSDVLGALPRHRPHRRSDKRATPAPADPAATERGATSSRAQAPTAQAPTALPRATRRRPEPLRQPAQPAGVPTPPRARRPEQPRPTHILATAAQAAAELAEIGLSVGARAVRNAVRRLPRP
jgi:hypothetical protein